MKGSSKHSVVQAAGSGIVLCLLGSLMWFFPLRWASTEEKFWTLFLFILCAIPSLAYIGGHKFRIPLMPLWGVGYFMLFGMPLISGEGKFDLDGMPSAPVIAALRLVVLGAGVCLVMFYTPLGKWAELFLPQVRAPWDEQRAPAAGTVLCLVGLPLTYLFRSGVASSAWSQLLFIGSQLAVAGIVTLFLLHLRGKLTLLLKIFLWVFVVPLLYLLGLGTGSVYNALVILGSLLFCYTTERRRIPWVPALVVLLVCFVPFSAFKGEYRSYVWFGERGDLYSSPIKRGLLFFDIVLNRLQEGGVESYTVAMESAQQRVSHTNLLVTVMGMTPSTIPFWGGETYRSLLWALVPRFLYPNKPRKTVGQEFGHRYSLLNEDDFHTSLNLPYSIVEMYVNFGVPGVWIGMALVGLFYRVLMTILSHPDSGERSAIVGCTIMTTLLNMDSNFSLVMGALIYYIPIFYLATRGLGRKLLPAKAGA